MPTFTESLPLAILAPRYRAQAAALNIAFFSNQFAAARGHGITRYSRELFAAIRAGHPEVQLTPVAAWSNIEAEALSALRRQSGLTLLPWGRRLTPLSWAFFDRPRLEHWIDGPVDLVHALSLGYPVATARPYVVTVHDLGPLTQPDYFTPKGTWIMRRSLRQALDRADRFVCVSQATADELAGYVDHDLSDRVAVVPEGVSRVFLEPPEALAIPEVLGLADEGIPYILSAGKISPRKNTLRTIEALARVADEIPHHLVLIGGGELAELDLSADSPLAGIAERLHFLGYVPDAQIPALYAAASAYVHASLYEGFGLPLLEAMACGCPVITSDRTSLPEVAGDAALLVDPTRAEAIADAMLRVCTDDELCENLAARGRQRIEKFSWERCAAGVVEVYRQLA
jgi:glycosyltransferase involved in cell wall biosynthesis